jgi:hypothetical protein
MKDFLLNFLNRTEGSKTRQQFVELYANKMFSISIFELRQNFLACCRMQELITILSVTSVSDFCEMPDFTARLTFLQI